MTLSLSKHRSNKWLCLGLACLTFWVTGCSHTLEVKNLYMYKPDFPDSQRFGSKIGLSASTNSIYEERLVTSVADSLKKNGFQVITPFYPSEQNNRSVDLIVNLVTSSQYEGSGWNFLVNWPGFLIWTPAWHGYNYGAKFGFDIAITDTKTNQTLPDLSIPMDLVIRHAAMNRTWTEISWLEWSAIAFIGGIVFTRYDKSVTPKLIEYIEDRVGDYVAGKITSAIASSDFTDTSKSRREMEIPLAEGPAVKDAAVPMPSPSGFLPATGEESEKSK